MGSAGRQTQTTQEQLSANQTASTMLGASCRGMVRGVQLLHIATDASRLWSNEMSGSGRGAVARDLAGRGGCRGTRPCETAATARDGVMRCWENPFRQLEAKQMEHHILGDVDSRQC